MDSGIATIYGAIIGAFAGFVGGVVAGFFNLRATNNLIVADRNKLAYEKQIDALRAIYTATTKYQYQLRRFAAEVLKTKNINQSIKGVHYSDIVDAFDEVYAYHRVFIPYNINACYEEYFKFFDNRLNNTVFVTAESDEQWRAISEAFDKQEEYFTTILQDIQKHIGVE